MTKKIQKPIAQPNVQTLLQKAQAQFKRLKEIQKELSRIKDLYKEQDALLKELIPLFYEVGPDKIVINRTLTIGNEKYIYTPAVLEKSELKPTVWRASAQKTGHIEVA